jgi:integrase
MTTRPKNLPFDRRPSSAVAKLPKLSLHGLRHSYATLALASGMKPWDLSDRLGHASVAFTLSVYRHAIQGSQDDAATEAAAFILR